ncbi:MAG: tRNA pseudouridine(38-40) synthase TruA [Acidobacteria bacterium]|nr:tRNA pseudouridine(38-40) synthase TruA [Acidobacteriota bacterium]
MNYKITIAYDGTNYRGWQMQGEHPTIQLAISQALAKLEGAPVTVHGAGRTDSGVHAEGQVASFHLSKDWDGKALRKALNGNLPSDIRVYSAEQVDDEFHARFSAKRKTYRYQIYNAEVMNPLLARYAWHFAYALNPEKLTHDGQALCGTHDFTTFTVADCETNTNVRTITDFFWKQSNSLLQLYFRGEGFLRYQVRTMVIALLELNRGRIAMTMPELIRSQKRELIRGSAPAKGLTLLAVEY